MTDDENPRIEDESPRVDLPDRVRLPTSKSALKRLCATVLGGHARLWSRNGQIEVGLERGDKKVVLAIGPTPQIAWMALVEAATRAGAKERGESVPQGEEQSDLRNEESPRE
jgi:hypothetical protein